MPWALAGLVLLTGVAFAASYTANPGSGHGPVIALARVVEVMAPATLAAGALLAAATGFGIVLQPLLLPGARNTWPIRVAFGLAAAFTIWHLLGVAGLLGPMVAWCTAGVGLVALGRHAFAKRVLLRSQVDLSPLPLWILGGLPGIVLLIAAVASPPGALWDSEFGAYDALSYHLPLPQQWLADGRVWPSQSNVYSYLPGYMEVAFAQLGAITLAEMGDGGLLAGSGWRAHGCQALHGATTLLSAWMVSRVALSFAPEGWSGFQRRLAGGLAGAMVLGTPWAVVVGSLAYNEMPVVLLGAAAMLVARESACSPVRRGVSVGILVGAACGVKPTAILLVAPAAGIALIDGASRRVVIPALGAAAAVGLAMLLPWLVRNAIASGNPVFPFADALLGGGHWSAFQHTAWDSAHSVNGGFWDRLRLALWQDPAAGDAAADVQRWRGVLNPQWGWLWPVAVIAFLGSVSVKSTRRSALALGAGLGAGIAAWLVFTHIQARFLVPLIAIAAPLVGIGVGLVARTNVRGLGLLVAATCVGLQSFAGVRAWARQAGGAPNALLLVGVPGLRDAQEAAVEDLGPVQFVNRLERTGVLVLLGEARALYFDPSHGPVIASSLWDRGVLEQAMEADAADADPDAWIVALREAGASHVLVNFAELDRAERSGYRPETIGPAAAARLAAGLVPVRAWESLGIALFEVPTGSTIDLE